MTRPFFDGSVALYGAGRMGQHHARHLQALARRVVVIDPALGLTAELGQIDAVVVATPTNTHHAVAEPWLARGVPTLVEKPLASVSLEAESLAEYPNLSVGHIERYNPAFRVLVEGGAASGGAAVSSAAAPRFVQADRLAPWTNRSFDADVVFDMMIHDLDLFLVLTQGEEIAEVRANGVSVTTSALDIAHARIETVSGRVGLFAASRISRRPLRSLRVFGPGSYWSIDLGEKSAARVGADLKEEVITVPPTDALESELRAFLGAVATGAPMPISGSEALASIRLADRIRCAC